MTELWETVREKALLGRLCLLAACALGVFVAVYIAFCAAASRDEIAPHTTIGAVDVGGLTRDEAARVLGGALDALREEAGVRVTLEDGTEAAYLSYAALGAEFDAQALADAAYRSSHSGNTLADGWTLLRAAFGGGTRIVPEPDAGWTSPAAKRLAAAAEAERVDFAYALADAQTLRLTRARDGCAVDAGELEARLDASTPDASGSRAVALPYTTLPAEAGDLAALHAELGGEAVNARYDAEAELIVPERVPVRFDLARARALLDAAAPGETVDVPVERILPAVTAEELARGLFRDVLSSYTTDVSGTEGHNANVRLTAERVNDVVLGSGEMFSYLAHTAPYGASNGYQPAPGYLNGKTVDMYGGGACQCSSTLYAAVLLANLEIVTRTAHGFAVEYVPPGLDATVSGGGPDFVFRNDTDYPVKIKATCDDEHLTVAILGTKTDGATVRIRREILSTTPYEEQIVEDPTLAPGERVEDVEPYTGYTVKTYRQLCAADGTLLSERYEATSRYKKRDGVIRVGPSASEGTGEV